MAIPTQIAALLAQNQPIVPSAERSQYSESREVWNYNSGAEGEANPLGLQLIKAVPKVLAGYAAYHGIPGIAAFAEEQLQNQVLEDGNFSSIHTVKDLFTKNTAKQVLNRSKVIGRNKTLDFLSTLDHTNKANFWYSGLKTVEQTGLGLPVVDSVISLFTKATYLSDVLSFFVERNDKYFLNVSAKTLGAYSRKKTLDLYSEQLKISRKKLDFIDYLIFKDGDVFEGKLYPDGTIRSVLEKVTKEGKDFLEPVPLNRVKARLVDKGKFSESVLTILDPEMGTKNPFTGGTLAESIGGKENFVLFSADTIDTKMEKILSLQDKIPFLRNKKKINANGALLVESYATMALHRTSNLFSEMFNEFGGFFEYLLPQAKKSFFSFAYKNKLTPKITHGHGMAMLGRYSALATAVGLGLGALNQIGYSAQDGNLITKPLAIAAQTAGLAFVGNLIGSKFRKGNLGTAIGVGLGALAGIGIGPFANGPIPGVANLYARLSEIRSYATEALQINRYKRSVEEMMPGSTKLSTAIGMGALLGTSYVYASRFLNKGKIVEQSHRETYLRHYYEGDHEESLLFFYNQNRKIRTETFELKKSAAEQRKGPNGHLFDEEEYERRLAEIRGINLSHNKPDRPEGMTEEQVSRIEKELSSYFDFLLKRGEHTVLNNKIGKTDTHNAFKEFSETLTQFIDQESREKILRSHTGLLKRLSSAIEYAPKPRAIAYAALVGAIGWWAATGGPGTLEKPSELRELNQGKRLEAVRRSQKWEMGQGGYEGDDILFYRPTLTARLSSGAVQKGSTGNHGPIEELILKNFTYALERENYWKRPAPITGAAFDQVPFIYPFIQPIANLIKKPKLMHVNEWARQDADGNVLYLERSDGLDEIPDPKIGAKGLPAPYSPYSSGRVLGRFWEQATDLGGLVGYFGRTAKLALTGDKSFYDQRQQLESFSENADTISKFYDLHGGGSFLGIPFTSEPIRRFLKKEDLKKYNPIRNTMPTWMPDNTKFGNPYVETRHGGGEYRVPGEGYEALHPELKNLNPEYYPLIHRLNILGDIAPYSSEYKSKARDVELMYAAGDMTKEELSFYSKHKRQLKSRKEKRSYDNYQFRPTSLQTLTGTVTSVDPSTMSFTLDEYGGRFGIAGISNDIEDLISDYNLSIKNAAKQKIKNESAFSSKIKKGMSLTVEVPASIGQAVNEEGIIKASVRNNLFSVNQDIREAGSFSKDDSFIASYAMTNPIGRIAGRLWELGTHTANAAAQPIEHLLMFGAAPINKFLPFRDALEDYQSREKYGTEMKSWEDPIGGWIAPAIKSALHNWVGLNFDSPELREKRDAEEYFDKLKYFKYTELEKSASLIGNTALSEQYKNIAQHTAIGGNGWVNKDRIANALGGRESSFAIGFANEYNLGRQEEILEELPEYKRKIMEDYYLNADLIAINRAASAASMSTTGMDYAASLLLKKKNEGYEEDENPLEERNKEIEKYFKHKYLPAVNWVGWNPAVDLEDVKMRYIQNEGMDYHDFGMFSSRASYLERKSYITDDDVSSLNTGTFFNSLKSMANSGNISKAYGINTYNIRGPSTIGNTIDLQYNETVDLNPFEE